MNKEMLKSPVFSHLCVSCGDYFIPVVAVNKTVCNISNIILVLSNIIIYNNFVLNKE